MKAISILISSYHSGEALELCIESIKKKTLYKNYKIIVLDSSGKGSKTREYLDNTPYIDYQWDAESQLRHGQALDILTRQCETPLAVILDSDVEILRGDWLHQLTFRPIEDDVIGVGHLREGGNFTKYGFWRVPIYLPFCLLLNVDAYRKIGAGVNDWIDHYIPMSEYAYKDRFTEASYRAYHPIDSSLEKVHYDTAGGFSERVLFENPDGLTMYPLPPAFIKDTIYHYEGMTAHRASLDSERMSPKAERVKERLRFLRGQ